MLMDAVVENRISSSEAILYLKSDAARELHRLARVQTVSKASCTTSDPADRARKDWTYRKTFELMAHHCVQVMLNPSLKEALEEFRKDVVRIALRDGRSRSSGLPGCGRFEAARPVAGTASTWSFRRISRSSRARALAAIVARG